MRKPLCSALLLMLSVSCWGDTGAHPVTLWQAKGLSNSVYLLGSIHLLRSADYPLPFCD